VVSRLFSVLSVSFAKIAMSSSRGAFNSSGSPSHAVDASPQQRQLLSDDAPAVLASAPPEAVRHFLETPAGPAHCAQSGVDPVEALATLASDPVLAVRGSRAGAVIVIVVKAHMSIRNVGCVGDGRLRPRSPGWGGVVARQS
jgi:hypothetical protein